jgi:hypothetical protein
VRVLVVDGANVMGSRPDGWWRDRAAAAGRLHDLLATSDLPYDEVVLVLEGGARAGRPTGREGCVTTVHAAGSGDDAVVSVVQQQVREGHDVVVATADRELRSRVSEAGGASTGPSTVLGRAGDGRAR